MSDPTSPATGDDGRWVPPYPPPGSPHPPPGSPYPPGSPLPPGPPPGQYYAQAPPYWMSGPAPARRRRSRWLTVGLPIAVVSLLVLGGCGIAVWQIVGAVRDGVLPAQQAADAYAGALVDQRWDDAHELLCESTREAVTADDLAAHHAEPPLTGYSIEGVRVSNVNGHETAEADIRFTTADGLSDRTTVPLVRDGDQWQPCP